MTFLALSGVRKSFGGAAVVKDFSLAVERGELVSFLGPSGSGKTTVLRMIAGFETPSAGAISIGGRDVTHLAANRRAIGMVFQAYALFPNMTVERNIGFGLRVAGKPAPEIAARVAEMLALIKLPDLAGRYPHQLSGGQQQRVSLARALAPAPEILLLDEPLSALDARIRLSLREEIRALQRRLGVTTIFVTHDQEEALSISDRIVVMNEGAIAQVSSSATVSASPGSASRLTSPRSCARSASIGSPVSAISIATLRGSARGSRSRPPPAATSDRLTSGMASRAPREATIRSHASATSSPPANAKPSIATISGLSAERWVMPAKPRPSTNGRSPVTNAFRSIPAQNPLPAPVITPTLRSGSASSSTSAPAIPAATAAFTAFR